jgi:N-acetylmuramoyl-L-alanine amidase
VYENLTDEQLMSRVMWLEARGEQQEGMRAVGHVIHNRVGAAGFPKTLRAVMLQPNAFSSLLSTDPEYGKEPATNDPQYSFCLQTVPRILAGVDVDLTCGAHFYLNPQEAKSGWFFRHVVQDTVNHPLTVTIGKQNFYK